MGRTTGYAPLPVVVGRPPAAAAASGAGARAVKRPRLALLAAAVLCLVIYCMTNFAPEPSLQLGPDAALNQAEAFDSLFAASRDGWAPVDRTGRGLGKNPAITSADSFPEACADQWVARGELCEEVVEEMKRAGREAVDVLYTYTNGTDRLLRTWREFLVTSTRRESRAVVKRVRGRPGVERPRMQVSPKGLNHFREHDELRYSLRSVVAAFAPAALRQIHLLTADVPFGLLPKDMAQSPQLKPSDNTTSGLPVGTVLVGQTPIWLNVTESSNADPPLELVHHSSVFRETGAEDNMDFFSSSLPTFNSLAIEARMSSVPDLREHVLYMNDDNFLMGNLSAADVGSPLTGPVFRVQRDLLVSEVQPGQFAGSSDGEWPGLRHANWLLNQRFGRRERGYLAHIAKTLSTPLLREAQALWESELQNTSESRFRGFKVEYQLLFLSTHYIIERHREALLWSFFVARADQDHDGDLSATERQRVLDDLGFARGTTSIVAHLPIRDTVAGNDVLLAQSGLSKPLATNTTFDSRDGFAMTSWSRVLDKHGGALGWPVRKDGTEAEPVCTIRLAHCLGDSFASPSGTTSATAVLRRMFDRPECGDCIILQLVSKSGPRGLSAFLPELEDSDGPLDGPALAVEPLDRTAKKFEDADWGATGLTARAARRRAVQLIQRYSYTIGATRSQFLPMRSKGLVLTALCALNDVFAAQNRRPPPATPLPTFLTLNDDLTSTKESYQVDKLLHKFFSLAWPHPSPYERSS